MRDDVDVSDAPPYVEKAFIKNFGCVREVELELTRLHALIGTNDSGKSSVLAALRTMGSALQRDKSSKPWLDPRLKNATISIEWGTTRYQLHDDGGSQLLKRFVEGRVEQEFALSFVAPHTPLSGARLIRWDPDEIRRPATLIPESQTLTMEEKGGGLAAVYEAILSRDRAVFDAIEADVRRLFPTIKSLWLPTVGRGQKTLGATLLDGTRVQAPMLSEGVLYWLAFAALPHIDHISVLLIEEPENGLHPTRIAEVMKTLREMSKRTQIIISTHNPLVLDAMQPEEITLLSRDAQVGTKATRIDRTKYYKAREKGIAFSELTFGDSKAHAAPES